MNAYELAQKLNDAVNKNEKHVTLDIQAMLMLRQQADRIAELEKQGDPVAWIDGNEICPEIGYEATITTEHPKTLGWKPLYTTLQTKPLSDEEIIEIVNEWGKEEFAEDYSEPEKQDYKHMFNLIRLVEAKVRGEK